MFPPMFRALFSLMFRALFSRVFWALMPFTARRRLAPTVFGTWLRVPI